MTTISKASIDVIQRTSGSHLSQSRVQIVHRASGSHMSNAQIIAVHRELLLSVRIASIYFGTEQISLKEVFDKTNSNSLRELVQRENNL